MARIFKYRLNDAFLDGGDLITVDIPRGELLDVQLQGQEIVAWVLHDGSTEHEPRTFAFVPTGPTFDAKHWRYVRTVQVRALVWHVFERVAE